ncbi:MAG: acyl-CoA thioesterase domain-containing protein, partial [Pseudomonadota bacterium]
MSDAIDDLLALLALEPLEGDLFRGTGAGGETRLRIFGGQVVAQGLAAASQTVDPARGAHSLHAYFLRPGDPTRPVIYDVDRARDGGSFTTRRVVAMQDGRQILNMAASFHRKEAGYDHAHDMGDWPPPEELAPREALKARVAATADPARRADILRPSAIDVRPIDPVDYAAPEPKADRHAAWLRLSRPVTGLEAWQERCLLAYISDLLLLWS